MTRFYSFRDITSKKIIDSVENEDEDTRCLGDVENSTNELNDEVDASAAISFIVYNFSGTACQVSIQF